MHAIGLGWMRPRKLGTSLNTRNRRKTEIPTALLMSSAETYQAGSRLGILAPPWHRGETRHIDIPPQHNAEQRDDDQVHGQLREQMMRSTPAYRGQEDSPLPHSQLCYIRVQWLQTQRPQLSEKAARETDGEAAGCDCTVRG